MSWCEVSGEVGGNEGNELLLLLLLTGQHSYKIQQVRDKAVQKGRVEPHRTADLPSGVWLAREFTWARERIPPARGVKKPQILL